jgi:hypothetical protein
MHGRPGAGREGIWNAGRLRNFFTYGNNKKLNSRKGWFPIALVRTTQ